MKSLPTIVIGKPKEGLHLECGNCQACCIVFEIESLRKPQGVKCEHLCSTGCSIYVGRPGQCKEFRCHWLNGRVMDGKRAYRPDKLGLIITLMDTPPLIGVLGVFRTTKGKLDSRAQKLLKVMEEKTIFFFEDKLYGPQEMLDKWKEQWKVKIGEPK